MKLKTPNHFKAVFLARVPRWLSLVGLNGISTPFMGCRHEVMLTSAAWPSFPAWPSNYISLTSSDSSPQQLFQTCMWLNLLPLLLPPHSQQVTEEQEALVKGECPQHWAISNPSVPSISLLPQEPSSSLFSTLSAQLLTLHLFCILKLSSANDLLSTFEFLKSLCLKTNKHFPPTLITASHHHTCSMHAWPCF